MLFLKRLPGIVYSHRHSASIVFCLFLVFIYLLFHWGFVCTNLEPWNHVKYLCNQYQKGLVVGNLCHPLCEEGRIGSFSCQTFHAGKEVVFSGVKDENSRLVFKLARHLDQQSQSTVYWLENGVEKYPTEAEFTKMIVDHIGNRLNTSVSPDLASSLGRFSQSVESHSMDRHLEMREVWTLLQDNEYLLASLYSGSDVFPRVLGSCGQYFALEYLEPAIEGHVAAEEGVWPTRVKLAVLVLDLLQEIDNSVGEGFSLCDIKPSHFGLSPSSGKMKFLDLDVALPRTVVNTITADGSTCNINTDCSLFDCRSKCNMDTHKCDSPQTNDNLQGWSVYSTI
ncbi:divergent protein kinase domain 1C isoform X2 [Macrosteles quadrilineatus]|uniref:divergent protein kinase domain 1C isoform X2 n=1 Tax=Macrosteles quadrilineatus TaxID=74068 RepID=UPI0023E101CC|nr:divergent protein kinase domain 1C isoform X2 [Macrosteles quadrilineatus]